MQLAARDPVKRHQSEVFNYALLFNGQSWELSGEGLQGRTPAQAYHLIRQAAWRRRVSVTIEVGADYVIVALKPGGAA